MKRKFSSCLALGFSICMAVAWSGCASKPTDTDPRCGDSIVSPEINETCDDGNTVAGDGCSPLCVIEPAVCGNGRVEGSEGCDDGNTVAGDGCSPQCGRESNRVCGNGTVEPGEVCDDGNMANTDDCLNSCIAARCGDGNLRAGVEQCDSGAANSNSVPNACRTNCQTARCGDGTKDTPTETCDDGNLVSDDGCSATCVREPRCGDGVLDAPAETCDDGNRVSGDGCDMACLKEPQCGDGEITPPEQCDDMNTMAGDGCSAACAYEAGHFFELEPNDAVATPNVVPTLPIVIHGITGSSSNDDYFKITLPYGTDLKLETYTSLVAGVRTCPSVDTRIDFYALGSTTALAGNDEKSSSDRCSLLDPTSTAAMRHLAPGEYIVKVHHYSSGTEPYLLAVDLTTQCGNNMLEGSEECDDGNTVSGDRCANDCTIEPICGNMIVERNEQCDDGNMVNTDACNNMCRFVVGMEVEPNDLTTNATPLGAGDRLFVGAIMPVADHDFYSFTLAQRASIEIETFDGSGPNNCASIDTEIELYSGAGAKLGQDDQGGEGSCSKLDPTISAAVRNMAPGTYYVMVKRYADTQTIPSYHLRLRRVAVCGNMTIEAGEMCDDGNTVDTDGCNNLCVLPPVAESEPNDDGMVGIGMSDFLASAADGPYSTDVLLTGALNPAGDDDVFAVQNTGMTPKMVHLETFGGDGYLTCVDLDSIITVRNAAGTELGRDDEGGVSSCSMLNYAIPAMTTVYVQVQDYLDNDLKTKYYLWVDF